MSEIIKIPDTANLETRVVEYSSYPQIASATDYQRSAEVLVGIKSLRTEIENTFNPIIKAATDLVSSIRKTRDKLTDPLDMARKSIESGRIEFETKRELERLQNEVAAAHPVITLDDLGFEEESVAPYHAPVMPDLPKSRGVSTSTRWSAEVSDFMALIKAVADGRAPLECLLPNQPFLNNMARISRTTLNVPGVKPVRKRVTAVRV